MEQRQSYKLTLKQENFCLAYIETGNASEAYRQAYQAGNMAPATINRKATELLDNGKITARLQELRQPAIDKAQVTLEQHLEDLKVLRDKASEDGKYSAAIQAEIARGKAAGLYSEKIEVAQDMHVKYGLEYFYGEAPEEVYQEMIKGN